VVQREYPHEPVAMYKDLRCGSPTPLHRQLLLQGVRRKTVPTCVAFIGPPLLVQEFTFLHELASANRSRRGMQGKAEAMALHHNLVKCSETCRKAPPNPQQNL
jgi:hypothetical protein